MKIAMFMRGFAGWTTTDPDREPIAGSETQVIRLGRALQDLGHSVVFSEDPTEFQKMKGDIAIICRWPELCREVYDNFERIHFWTGDDIDQPFLHVLRHGRDRSAFLNSVSVIFAISDYQKLRFAEIGIPPERVVRIRYGLPDRAFSPGPDGSDEFRKPICVFSSVPYKGLHLVPDLWKRVVEQVPEAALRVFSSMAIHGKDANADKEYQDTFRTLKGLSGVVLNKAVPQPVLYGHLWEAACWFYPNSFAETFCMSGLEARVTGAIPITSMIGALPETCAGGVMVVGRPGTRPYCDFFVDQTVRVLTDEAYQITLRKNCRDGIEKYRMVRIAREWNYWLGQDLRSLSPVSW